MFREQFREHHKDSKMLEVVSTQKILWNFSKPSSQEEGQLEVPISILTAFWLKLVHDADGLLASMHLAGFKQVSNQYI